MSYQTINLTIEARGIARITLARPDKHNCMNAAMLDELTRVAKQVDQDATVRAVVLSGQGSSFCAGADLDWMRNNLQQPRQQRIAESKKLTELLHQFKIISKLLIARVNGQAYAGGIGLIAVCDIAIGVRAARFSLTETKLGLAPANLSSYVVARMGRQNARRCMLNAHVFHADEAVALGLLDKAVPAEQLDESVQQELTELLNCAPQAVATTKQLLARIATLNDAESKQYTSELLADMWEHAEAKEGINAFFEKRKPQWAK